MSIFERIARLLGGGTKLEALPAGAPAPPFTLKGVNGKTYALSDALKQGPVLLAFFKVSCPVCQFTFPFIERLQQGIKGSDHLQIWGISQDDARDTRSFAQEYGCTFPLLLDDDGYPVSNNYGLSYVPTLFLVKPAEAGKPEGVIQVSSVGFDRKDIETVAANFSRLAGRALSVFQPGDNVPDYKPG